MLALVCVQVMKRGWELFLKTHCTLPQCSMCYFEKFHSVHKVFIRLFQYRINHDYIYSDKIDRYWDLLALTKRDTQLSVLVTGRATHPVIKQRKESRVLYKSSWGSLSSLGESLGASLFSQKSCVASWGIEFKRCTSLPGIQSAMKRCYRAALCTALEF